MYFISTSLMSYLGLLETSTKFIFLARQPNVAYIIYMHQKKRLPLGNRFFMSNLLINEFL